MAEACWPDEEADITEGYPQWSEPPELVIDDSGETAYTATIETSEGDIAIDLLPAEAPETVNNFVCLATAGYYDDTVFHRVVPEFVIQGGDPTATGTGGPGYRFDDEPIERDYQTGTLAMANAGPDTNGSQFFIVLEGGADFLEPLYTIFGEVADGDSLDVVEEIGETDPEEEPVAVETIVIEGDEGDETGNVLVEGDDYEGVIFDAANAAGLIDAEEYWTPDEDDVEDLEAELEGFLEEAVEDGLIGEDAFDDLPDYLRQYAGFVADDDRLIFANFFCDDFDLDWQEEPVLVEDGGDCFFTLVYDPERERFSDLFVNGEA
jgi:cyclophilin family peptidyl-prolyl cis-trans isomerase